MKQWSNSLHKETLKEQNQQIKIFDLLNIISGYQFC